MVKTMPRFNPYPMKTRKQSSTFLSVFIIFIGEPLILCG